MGYGQSGPPPCPPPWFAEWDGRDQRWLYINRENGERTFQHPEPSYYQGGGGYGEQRGYGGGYGQQQGGYGGSGGYGQPQGGYGGYEQQAPPPEEKKSHGLLYGALGAAGGLLAGGLAVHEADKVGMLFFSYIFSSTHQP